MPKVPLNHLLMVVKFTLDVFVVPKCMGGLCSILNIQWFSCYLHIPTFRMPTIKHLWQVIQQGDSAFSNDLTDAYLHISIVVCHCSFCILFGKVTYLWKVMPLQLAVAPRFFTSLTNPISFSTNGKGFHVIIYLDDILGLIHSKHPDNRAQSFVLF